jgi:hypothetical protein
MQEMAIEKRKFVFLCKFFKTFAQKMSEKFEDAN